MLYTVYDYLKITVCSNVKRRSLTIIILTDIEVNKKNKMRKEVEKETDQNPMFNFDFDEVFKFDDLSAEEEE
jgi:hypothetical protein